jgi:hypothetical protein
MCAGRWEDGDRQIQLHGQVVSTANVTWESSPSLACLLSSVYEKD